MSESRYKSASEPACSVEIKGYWKDNRKHGICMYTEPNGDIKIAEYIDDMQDPHGKMTFISKMSGSFFNVTYNGDLK